MFQCDYCFEKHRTIELYIKHLRKFHSSAPNLKLICGRPGCPKTFKSFDSRSIHDVDKIDENSEKEIDETENLSPTSIRQEDINLEDMDQNLEIQNECTFENFADFEQSEFGKKEHSEAQFILSLRAMAIPQTTVNKIIENTSILVHSCVEKYNDKVVEALREKGIKLEEFLNVEKVMEKRFRCI